MLMMESVRVERGLMEPFSFLYASRPEFACRKIHSALKIFPRSRTEESGARILYDCTQVSNVGGTVL